MAADTQSSGTTETAAETKAREVEQQMTDEERFSLLVSVMGVNDVVTVRDDRIPEGTPMSAGYVPGVERLGVPAQLMSDASLGPVKEPRRAPGGCKPSSDGVLGNADTSSIGMAESTA
jgi:beta-glucosidase